MSGMLDAALLIDKISEGATFQGVVDFGAEALGNPLLVCDMRFRILFMSKEDNFSIPLWQKARLEGYISDAVLADMKQQNTVELLQSTDTPVFSILPNGYHSLRTALRNKGDYCGFVGMYDYVTPFSDAGKQGLTLIGKALSILAADDPNFAVTQETERESLLFQLLCCETKDQADIICRRLAPDTSPGEMRLLCLRPSSDSFLPLTRLKDILKEWMPGMPTLLYNDNIVILLSRWENEKDSLTDIIENVKCFREKHRMIMGCSAAFTDLAYIPIAFVQARACFHHTETQALFEDVVQNEMRRICLEQHPASFYIHPVFRMIQTYDHEYHLGYLHTLLAYLRHQGNMRDTANELNIHYNTMKHRLSVIEEIIGIRLRDDCSLMRTLALLSIFVSDDK